MISSNNKIFLLQDLWVKRFLLQMMWKLIGVFTVLVVVSTRGDPVYILSENMQQMITSTSLQWVPADKHSKIDFQDAVVGAHQETEGKYAVSDFKTL